MRNQIRWAEATMDSRKSYGLVGPHELGIAVWQAVDRVQSADLDMSELKSV